LARTNEETGSEETFFAVTDLDRSKGALEIVSALQKLG